MAALNIYGQSRDASWRVDLCNRQGDVLDVLRGVEPSGKIDLSTYADIYGRAQVTFTSPKAIPIDWRDYWLRFNYIVVQPAAIASVTPILTALPIPGEETHSDEGMSLDLELYDPSVILETDTYGVTWGLDAGIAIFPAIDEIMTSAGVPKWAIPNSGAVLSAAMVWDRNVSKLRIVNDLLSAAGYWSLRADPMGVLRSDPYVNDDERPVVWDFGDTGIYSPDWTLTRDEWETPNKVILHQRIDTAEAEDVPTAGPVEAVLPPDHPASFESTGRWRPVIEEADFPTNVAGEARARVRLAALSAVSETRAIVHPWIPLVLPRAIVRHSNPRRPTSIRAVVERCHVAVNAGGLWETTMRRLSE